MPCFLLQHDLAWYRLLRRVSYLKACHIPINFSFSCQGIYQSSTVCMSWKRLPLFQPLICYRFLYMCIYRFYFFVDLHAEIWACKGQCQVVWLASAFFDATKVISVKCLHDGSCN